VILLPAAIGRAIDQYCSDLLDMTEIRNGVAIASRKSAIAIWKRVFDLFSLATMPIPYK